MTLLANPIGKITIIHELFCNLLNITNTCNLFLIKNNFSDLLLEINKIISENDIKGIVVGNPINLDGSSSNSSQSAKDLAINLSKNITIPITMWDERLSSRGAFNLSNDLELNSSSKIKKLDENSAQFILQGALDYLTKENT